MSVSVSIIQANEALHISKACDIRTCHLITDQSERNLLLSHRDRTRTKPYQNKLMYQLPRDLDAGGSTDYDEHAWQYEKDHRQR